MNLFLLNNINYTTLFNTTLSSSATNMASNNIWQLSWNPKNYDTRGRMLAAAASEEKRNMIQSWGRSPITNISKIKTGDIVYISSKKKCIGKAVVTQPFRQSTEIINDEFVRNQDEHEERHGNRWYCHLRITEFYFGEYRQDLRGNQNTFCNPTNAFWKN